MGAIRRAVPQRFVEQMRDLDRQVEERSRHAKMSPTSRIEEASRKGLEIAQRIKDECSKMQDSYLRFVEDNIRTVMRALQCLPEDMELLTYELAPDPSNSNFFISRQDIVAHGIPVLKIERFQVSEFEYQFRATPIQIEVGDETTN